MLEWHTSVVYTSFSLLSKYYLRIVAFYKDMKTFFRSRKEGNRIIEIKIREPTKSATKPEAIPVITPVSEPVKQRGYNDSYYGYGQRARR